MFLKGEIYTDDRGNNWTVDYDGVSCCGDRVVTFDGQIDGVRYGKTLDAVDAYAKREAGTLRKLGQLQLFGDLAAA